MIKDYIQLIRADKPIGTLLLLWPTMSALFIAAHGVPPLYTVVVFSLGVFLTRAAGCAINDVLDADFDKHVRRTASRPITSGRISKAQGVLTCIFLALLAFILACLFLRLSTLYYCLPSLLIFITYPLMKRWFPIPQAYLGVAFSFGILMAFVEITGRIGHLGFLLFAANLFWVLGYDTIYALEDIKDDLTIKIKSSAITMGKYAHAFVGLCYVVFMLLLLAIGSDLRLGISYYIALTMVAILLLYQLIIMQKKQYYLAMFRLNNWVGMAIFIGLAVSLS